MNLLPRTRELHFHEPLLVDSRTPGVAFEMTGSARWKVRRARHPDIEAVVSEAVFQRAQAVALTRHADDVHGAQDAINADLGTIRRSDSTRFYSALTANVTLRLSGQAQAHALEYRHSVAHIKRLRFLKEQLYSDPGMLLLDYLDKNPGQAADLPDLAYFQQLALKVSNGERWWCHILDALDKLTSQVPDQDGNFFAMNILIGVLKQAAPDLFKQYQAEEGHAQNTSAT